MKIVDQNRLIFVMPLGLGANRKRARSRISKSSASRKTFKQAACNNEQDRMAPTDMPTLVISNRIANVCVAQKKTPTDQPNHCLDNIHHCAVLLLLLISI